MSVTYKYQYEYDSKTYYDTWSVRRAIESKENKRFGPEPSDPDRQKQKELRTAFWAGHNVTYSEQEINTPEPDPKELLEAARQRKMQSLETWFNNYRTSNHTYVVSSLGFKANSNITAFNNVDGLIGLAEVASFAPEGNITFMDFEDKPHQLNKQDLIKLKNEISAAASMAYQTKWGYRQNILDATSEQMLNEIVFHMDPVDFTPKG